PLAGDASARQYFRLNLDGKMSVVMDAPLGQPDDPAAFVAVAEFLQSRGLSAPTVLAQDLQRGFLLLEDLGDALFVH
ncbi:MAG TPA: aminoglycoside phosphotransferase, partial [Rhodobacter sp.]|nr:aminoglycoside phosphotransferase [Rhodobacter sp.]